MIREKTISTSVKRATIIDGRAIAAKITSKILCTTKQLSEDYDIQPGLAVLLIGNDAASTIYVERKRKIADVCGFRSILRSLQSNIEQRDIIAILEEWNNDPAIHGILIQLPLPSHINSCEVLMSINPAKDVDGFHPLNVGLLNTGQLSEALIPCTALANITLAKHVISKNLTGMHAVVVGCSNIVGRPTAQLFLRENCTVTLAHRYTDNLDHVVQTADILVAAAGVPNLIKGSWIKKDAVIIDVGINRVPILENGRNRSAIVGDVEYDAAYKRASAITPVPGGVGPMTIAMLMSNTLEAMLRQNELMQYSF